MGSNAALSILLFLEDEEGTDNNLDGSSFAPFPRRLDAGQLFV
jgi:hypothetical protein